MNIADNLALYLVAQGLVTASGVTRLFMPASPDNCVTVYPTGGPVSDVKDGYDDRDVKVRVRNTDGATAIMVAENIYGALQGLGNITFVDGSYLVLCEAQQSAPIFIGRDELDRYEFTLNLRLHVRNKTTNRI